MLRTKPRLRIVGRGAHLRVRQRGDWVVDVPALLIEPCRAAIAIDKTLAEAIARARVSGMSWNKIGAVLGATDHADTKEELVDALADHRRVVLQRLLRETG